MTRVVRLDEFDDPAPVADRPLPMPDEPHPEFARMIHDDYRRCPKCKALYSCNSWARRFWLFRTQVERGDHIPPSFVENPTPCPHCERTNWRAEEQQVAASNANLDRRNHDRIKKWQVREDARHGIVPGRKKRAVQL